MNRAFFIARRGTCRGPLVKNGKAPWRWGILYAGDDARPDAERPGQPSGQSPAKPRPDRDQYVAHWRIGRRTSMSFAFPTRFQYAPQRSRGVTPALASVWVASAASFI